MPRLPVDAARKIRAGVVVFGQGSQRFLNLAPEMERGAKLPELILVGTVPGEPLVVLEGHVRLTACFLTPAHIPAELTVIIGFSAALGRWMAV